MISGSRACSLIFEYFKNIWPFYRWRGTFGKIFVRIKVFFWVQGCSPFVGLFSYTS